MATHTLAIQWRSGNNQTAQYVPSKTTDGELAGDVAVAASTTDMQIALAFVRSRVSSAPEHLISLIVTEIGNQIRYPCRRSLSLGCHRRAGAGRKSQQAGDRHDYPRDDPASIISQHPYLAHSPPATTISCHDISRDDVVVAHR